MKKLEAVECLSRSPYCSRVSPMLIVQVNSQNADISCLRGPQNRGGFHWNCWGVGCKLCTTVFFSMQQGTPIPTSGTWLQWCRKVSC